jgi:hypothetical protein
MTKQEILEEGYKPYGCYMNGDPESWMPPRRKLLSFMRESWSGPMLATVEELHPAMNVVGLYWKITSIGRENERRVG